MAEPTPTPIPAPTPTPAPAPVPAPAPQPPPVDPEKGFEKAMAKMNGDAQKLARRLYMDSHKDREKIRELTGKVPPDGAVILVGDELKAFESLKALGKKPEEIAAALTEHAELKSAEAKRTVEVQRGEFAELCGFNAKVLNKLLDDADIEIEVQEVPGPNGQPQKGRDGKILRLPMVKTEDPKDKRRSLFTPLPEYATKNWAEFLPALKGGGTVARPPGTPSPPAGPAPPQPPVAQTLYSGRSPF